MLKFTVIIPVYKSTKSLEVIAQQFKELQKEQAYQFEIIFVNDSPFALATVRTLENLKSVNSNIEVYSLRKNQGQHIATLVGMSKATGDYVITMDDDLQHPVKEIPKLIKAITSDANLDGVFGIPNYSERKHSLWRSIASYILKKIDLVFLHKPKGLVLSSFRIMTKPLANTVIASYNAMPAISSLMVNATSSLKNVKIEHNSREFGKTNYTFLKLFNLALNSILYYSSLPLKFLGFIGFFVFLLSILFIVFIFFQKLFNGIEFPGYASTVSLISFFGGLNLFALGLIGEYLIRVIREQQKPQLEDLIK